MLSRGCGFKNVIDILTGYCTKTAEFLFMKLTRMQRLTNGKQQTATKQQDKPSVSVISSKREVV